jgi:transposase
MYLRMNKLEVQMLQKEDFAVIKSLNQRGVYIKDIAAELGVHPKTVSRALKRKGAPNPNREPAGSKLEPYKSKIDRLLKEGVWNANVILREIQAEGYTGGYTVLRQYIQPKRVERPSRATVRFETEPGKQLQSDWGELVAEVGGKAVKVRFIVNQLGYSRRFHSFEYFGGVPQEVLVDNQKSAVLSHSNQSGAVFNERFVDLAGHYDFRPRACKPYRARTKGKDERMVGYIKGNFFVRYRSFESWAHLNQLAECWLVEEADQRLHGTVKEVVAERFEREKPTLKALPQVRYDTAYFELRRVAWDSYVNVRGNRYSVPARLVGQRVAIRISLDGTLRIYNAETLVATHVLRSSDEGWGVVPEHHADLWQDTLKVEQRPLSVYEEVA